MTESRRGKEKEGLNLTRGTWAADVAQAAPKTPIFMYLIRNMSPITLKAPCDFSASGSMTK